MEWKRLQKKKGIEAVINKLIYNEERCVEWREDAIQSKSSNIVVLFTAYEWNGQCRESKTDERKLD